jgi:flagellin
MRAEMAVNVQGVRNANDAISMVQTFDAAAGSIGSNLEQMAKLAMQAGTGTFSGVQKAAIEAEFNELASEINRVAGNTFFNGNNLIDGEGTVIPVALGMGEDIEIMSGDLRIDVAGMNLASDAGSVLSTIKSTIEQMNQYRGYLGGQMSRLSEATSALNTSIENAMAVESGISDTDIAMEAASSATSRIRAEVALAMQSQNNILHDTVTELLM